MNNYIKSLKILKDVKNGKEIKWKSKKIESLKLHESYKRLGDEKKSIRVFNCGSFLEFKKFDSGELKLHNANFCKVRLCPMCAWRRSLKIFGQVSQVMDNLDQKKYRFLFLTLTIKNCSPDDLRIEIDSILKSFNRMTRLKAFKPVLGYFRALEVTHNLITNEYHPHIHCILVVKNSYFKNKDYLSHSDWTDLWKRSLKVDYRPIVDIRAFSKNKNIKKSVSEVAKYSVKSNDFIIDDDLDLTDESVYILDSALRYKRLIAFGGIMKEIHQKLSLDDDLDDDLICTDNDVIRDDLSYIVERYCWNVGYKQYVRISD